MFLRLGVIFPPQINLSLTLVGDWFCSEKTAQNWTYMSLPLSNGMIRHFNNDHMELRRENYQNEDESKLKYEHSFNKMNE